MTTQYINQAVAYSDGVNSLSLLPNTGLVLTDGITSLVANTTGFNNGTQTLLFSDLYAGVQKTESVKFATSTATSLNVKDTIVVDDTLATLSSTITPALITLADTLNSNTLSATNWSGNYQTVNTTANITHYLNFSNASGTGYGKSQKTAGITCNPSTNSITATTFNGALSGTSTNTTNIAITNDNTSGTYFIPFSKLSTGNNLLYVDAVTAPLTYNPSTGVMNSLYFSGDIISPLTQNLATYAGSTLTISGASNGQNVSFRTSSIVIANGVGSGNLNTLTISNTINNGEYRIGILNNYGGNFVIGTSLGANIRTVYSGSFNIPNGRYAFMTINVITINSVINYIVNVSLLTN